MPFHLMKYVAILFTQLHNLKWEVEFGRQFGQSPEQSLSLLLDPSKIPSDLLTSSPQEWTPESIMAEFQGDNFLQMMDDMNQIIEVAG